MIFFFNSNESQSLTQGRGVIFGEHFVLGSVGVEKQEVIEITDAVSQRADGEIFGGVGH